MKHPHYDIWGKAKERALENGAKVVSSKEIVRILRWREVK
ncbi:MAG: DUF4031 domain-containing protein [bacterium]